MQTSDVLFPSSQPIQLEENEHVIIEHPIYASPQRTEGNV